MITENNIEKCIEIVNLFNDVNIDPFIEEQEEFLSYIRSEIAPSLMDHELKTFLFCASVIYNSFRQEHGQPLEFDIETFESKDEANWGERDKSTSFDKSKDILFEGYKEEDLLAFVEDLLVSEEEEQEELSDVGKEIIFLNAKSYIDTLSDSLLD